MPRPGKRTRTIPLSPLSGGVKTSVAPSLLAPGQAADAANVEFVDESIRAARGSRKLNNQTLLRPALLCRPDPAYSPLFVEAGKSVPMRGYVYRPYDPDTDIGGDFAFAGSFGSPVYHARRGRSFERQISVRIPEGFLMHDRPSRGEAAPTSGNAAIEAGCGYDEGLDDCTIILQKGGDRQPMSWALGIVNAGNHAYNVGLGSALARKSNYFLCFMWLDSPEWAPGAEFRYDLSTPAAPNAYATEALRAFILDGRNDTVAYALEPGKSYNISFSVTLDSGSPATSWNHDGRVDIRVQEENGRLWTGSFVDSGGGGVTTNLSAWKGPSDSLRYLSKYGIRYSGRDPEFLGLGYRYIPWNAQGYIPYGMDSAAMEHKGFRMADCSANTRDALYGVGAYTLVCSHAAGANAYVTINSNRALVNGNANGQQSATGRRGSAWGGYGAATLGAPATNFNADALRGYRVVFPASSVSGFQGGCFNIQNYVEQGAADFRLFLQDVGSTAVTWTDQPFLIRAFRWNQQAIEVQDYRMWRTSRSYSDPRVAWSMCHSLELDDETEPELSKLEGYLPLDDGGGQVCRELVRGRSAYLAPFGLGVGDDGQEGPRTLFLSGEGEALVYDLSEHPVFAREMKELLASNTRGFAIELSCIIPEAYYGVATNTPSGNRPNEYEAAYCPDLVSWAAKGADESGHQATALPLLTMGHHSWWPVGTGTSPERRPQGFHLDVSAGLDSEEKAMTAAVLGHTRSSGGAGNWDDTTPWVGKRITIQVGIQPSPDNRNLVANMENEYRVYIAATPKGALKYAQGENPQAEFAYYSDILIQRKNLPRLVVTIGGGWNPSLARGYTEYSARLIVDKVRVYGATASGELPTTTGLVTSDRRGKILGRNSLPQRELLPGEVLGPVGPGIRTADFREDDAVVRAPGGTSFYSQRPEATTESVLERFLVPLSDKFALPSTDDLPEEVQEFYLVRSVAADGSTMTLSTPYNGPRSPRGSAGITSLVGYTTFDPTDDDTLRSPLTLGAGQAYRPGLTTTGELVMSAGLFRDRSVVGGTWKVRVASPFTEGGLANVLPRWTNGIVSPRRGRVTGIASLDDSAFATCRGSISRIDDRWREDGPTTTLRKSLAILGRGVAGSEHHAPLFGDGVSFPNYSNAWPYWATAIYRDFTWVYDFWVWVEEYADYQTLLWLGCEYSHMLLGPAATDERRGVGLWLRLADGRPELVRESLGNFSGGATPPLDGRYIATAADRIPLRRWTHLRVYLDHYNNGSVDVLRLPGFKINGRTSRVTVNAVETGLAAATDWIRASNGGGLVGSAGDARNALYLGVARDSVRTYAKAQFTALAQLGGREFPGSRLCGRLHPLQGRLAGAVCWRAASSDPSVAGFPDFDPYTLDYTGRLVRWRALLQEGIGEHVADTGTDSASGTAIGAPGIVQSKPGLPLYNELGASDQPPSFAVAQQRVYVTNGGRPAFVTERSGGPAGILPPNTAPEVAVERRPLWEPNVAPIGSSSADQDPIVGESAEGTAQLFHYSTHGNAYLAQRWHEEMRWSGPLADPALTAFDIFGFKCYWKPRSVAGTQVIRSSRGSLDSGGIFIESVDGRARVGWYDTALKKRVWTETSAPVFRPGYWYYIYLRKSFPTHRGSRSATPFDPEGRWLNSYNVGGRRRSAEYWGASAGSAQAGEILRNGGSTKRALITKVWHYTTSGGLQRVKIDYVLFTGDADFAAAEVVNNGGAASGTIQFTPTATCGDSLVIREFSKTGTMLDTVLWGVKAGAHRCSVSFTASMPRPANTTAIGPVTPKGVLFNGAIGGVVTVGTMLAVAAPIPCFHADMVGMQFQFAATAANVVEKVYRISAVNSATQIVVVDEHGANPNLAGFTGREGAAFAGVTLTKSDDFDRSDAPDQGAYDTEFMGTALAKDPLNGVLGADGEFASFGWGVVAAAGALLHHYQGFLLFEGATPTELAEIGTDSFAVSIFNATTEASSSRPGELRFDSTRQFTVVDGQPYAGATPASTQPNAALEVRMDAQASANAESLFWKFTRDKANVSGRRTIFVAFYDADQAVISNPGPPLTVEVSAEDETNPGGMAQVVLTNLPVSHQPGTIHRYVYMTEADDIIPYRAAIVEDNRASSVAIRLDRDSELSDVLETDNPPPPNCSVLGISQAVMFYGDVEVSGVRRRDLILFSKPFLPLQVPAANALFLISGSNERVTAMADLNGVLLVWKKDAMIEVVVRDGAAFQSVKSSAVGCVGPQAALVLDQDAWWVSNDRGIYLYTGAGGPVWVGMNVSDLFDESNPTRQVDAAALERCALGVNRRQSLVQMLWKEASEKEQRRRFGLEFDTGLTELGVRRDPASSVRYMLYEGAAISALGAADRLVPGTQRFLGGTEDGFVVQLDRSGTLLELHEPGLAASVTLTAGSTTSRLALTAPPSGLADLEGVRGVPLAWVEGGVAKRATALFVDGSSIYLDRALASAPPSGAVVSIGAMPMLWRSKRFDMGNPEERKLPLWLSLVLEPKASGQAVVEVFVDANPTAKQLAVSGAVVPYYTLDLTISNHKIPLGEIRGRYFQFQIRTVPPASAVDLEVVELVLGLEDTELFS